MRVASILTGLHGQAFRGSSGTSPEQSRSPRTIVDPRTDLSARLDLDGPRRRRSAISRRPPHRAGARHEPGRRARHRNRRWISI